MTEWTAAHPMQFAAAALTGEVLLIVAGILLLVWLAKVRRA